MSQLPPPAPIPPPARAGAPGAVVSARPPRRTGFWTVRAGISRRAYWALALTGLITPLLMWAALAAWGGMAAGSRFFGFFQFGQDTPAILHIALTGLSDMHTAGRPGQQQGANTLLQCRHGAGHAGGRHAQAARGGSKALFFGHSQKYLHLLETVHHALL